MLSEPIFAARLGCSRLHVKNDGPNLRALGAEGKTFRQSKFLWHRLDIFMAVAAAMAVRALAFAGRCLFAASAQCEPQKSSHQVGKIDVGKLAIRSFGHRI